MDLSMFPTEFTELGPCTNITAICSSQKVVGQYCNQCKKGLIERNLFYQKCMKIIRDGNADYSDYLTFILNAPLFESQIDNDSNT